MARGLDKDKGDKTPPRRNPFRQEILDKSELDLAAQKEREAREARGEVIGESGTSLIHLDQERIIYISQDNEGYDCYELLDEQGREFFYETEEGLDNGDIATIVKEKETNNGSEKQEVWLKRRGNSYHEDSRKELRNSQGNLHSPDPETPALVIKKRKYDSSVQEAYYFNDGQLLKKVVYQSSFDEVGSRDNVAIFDSEGNLHSFDSLPARFHDHDGHEFYQHGELEDSGWSEYRVYEIGKRFFPVSAIEEVKDYKRRGQQTLLESREEKIEVTPDNIHARREKMREVD